MSLEKLQKKYATPGPETTAPPSPVRGRGYGCGKCAGREYELTSFNLWQCRRCGSLYPFIAKLKDRQRPVETMDGLEACRTCGSPWLIQSTREDYFCPDCQPRPVAEFVTLVCAAGRQKE